MVYITYAKSTGMYASQDEISICKKVLTGDSFEITSFYMSPRTSQPFDIDRNSENLEYHQHVVFTIRTDTGDTVEFNIDVGHILYKPDYSFYSRFNMTKNLKTETCPYLRKFDIVCPNSTVLFEPYYDKEKQEYVYSNTQLIDWLKEKISYIDSVFEKVSQVQKKKRELEADFKENIFDENEIETIIEKNKNK